MQVLLNGSQYALPDGASLKDAVDSLDVQDVRGVAVAVEGTVIPRSEWSEVRLSANQQIEVVRAVQGG